MTRRAAPSDIRATMPPPPSLWTRLRSARLPQLLGVYAGVCFGALQGVDLFVERLGVPDWTFAATLVLMLLGIPVVVMTALAQTPDSHPTGSEEGAATGSPAAAAAEPTGSPGALSRWFTWRRTLGIGAVSVGGLVLVVAGFMLLRALGVGGLGSLLAAGVLDERDQILLADFLSQTGDEALAGTVTEAFRVDLEQSPVVTLAQPIMVREALLRMQRPPDTALSPEVARELALREGIKAVLSGEVNTTGGAFVLTARLSNASDGETLASVRETAPDSTQLIGAVDRLSNQVRERIGESLRSIRQGEPLERVSTASLAALRRYSQGTRALDVERDYDRGIAFLEEAVELDPGFAMAWRKLGVGLMNQGVRREDALEAFRRAYEARERLTDRERYLTEATYFTYVEEDGNRAARIYETLLADYPNDGTALNNLAIRYGNTGRQEEAVELFSRALALDSSRVIYYTNPLSYLVELERFAEAEALADAYARRFPDLPETSMTLGNFHVASRRWDAAEIAFQQALTHPRQTEAERVGVLRALTALDGLRGKVESARRRHREAYTLARRLGVPWPGPDTLAFEAQIRMNVLADTAGALELFPAVEASLAAVPDADEVALARYQIAQFLASTGDAEAARGQVRAADGIRTALEGEGDSQLDPALDQLQAVTRAMIQMAEGDPNPYLAHHRETYATAPCKVCHHLFLARGHVAAEQPDSAVHHYTRSLDGGFYWRLDIDAQTRARSLLELAGLLEARGDTPGAIRRYREFVELWNDADPPLQPQVTEVRERIEQLEAHPTP